MNRIEIRELTKDHGSRRVVDHLTFDVLPGRVTGFLGPNGAGKSTTLRLLLGLDRPTSGSATIGGSRFADLDRPLRRVGPSSIPRRPTRAAGPATTSSRSPSATASHPPASTGSWSRPASRPSPAAASGPSHSACASAWA